jgi:hypothetical protein
MANPEMPFVAVIGGLWQLEEARAAAARNAGKVVGAELAKTGFGWLFISLMTHHSNPMSLRGTLKH